MRQGREVSRLEDDLDGLEGVRAHRELQAQLESPRGLAGVAAAVFALTLVQALVGDVGPVAFALHLGVAFVFAGSAWLIRRPRFMRQWVSPLVGLCTLVIVLQFQLEYWINPTVLGYAYIVVVMLGSPVFMLSAVTYVVVGTMTLVGALVVALRDPAVLEPAGVANWWVLALTAHVVGGILLYLRLRSIDELGRATRRAERLAGTDALTGLLNRHGLERSVDRLLVATRHTDWPVYAVFIDVDGLKQANDRHGHDFGDEVLRAVARASVQAAPQGCAVGRWGGDEFLAIGSGVAPDAGAVADELARLLSDGRIDLARWPGTVSVGIATQQARELDLAGLVTAADQLMYERRRAVRGDAPPAAG